MFFIHIRLGVLLGLLISVLMTLSLTAQLTDDFSDGDLSGDPVWLGDTNAYSVNADGLLQLDAANAGEHSLFAQVTYPDSVRWSGYALFDFAPSANNNGAIYLAIDNQDITIANGYILRLGENGSDDAIRLIRLTDGDETLLATGTAGAVGSDPAEFTYQITLDGDGMWTGFFGYNGGFPAEEFSLIETTHGMSSLEYFGVVTKVTSSNVDNVFFDDFSIVEDLPDTEPPSLVAITVVNAQTIDLLFDEPMDAVSLSDPSHYFLSPGGVTPSQVVIDADNPFGATLTYDPPLVGSTQYMLMVSGVTDLEGNAMVEAFRDFLIPETPEIGDLHLSEILFDPYIDQSDFVEIYNSSDKVISLNGTYIENQDKSERDYYSLIDDTEGVSLGRLSYITEANSPSNWISGTQNTNYATPGYANTGSIDLMTELNDFVQLESKVFSPNGDGDGEFLTLLYGLDKEGYLASVQIYDYRNQLVNQLANNQLIAAQDFMLWDGVYADGTKAPVGPYVLYVSVFHPDGDVMNKKLVAVLADFLD